jgi:hypothetical protein
VQHRAADLEHLIGADHQPFGAAAADRQGLFAREVAGDRGGLGRGRSRFGSALVDAGGLGLDLDARALQERPADGAVRGEKRRPRAPPEIHAARHRSHVAR